MKTRLWNVKKALKLYNTGVSIKTISKKIHRSYMTIYAAFRQYNCKFRSIGPIIKRSKQAILFSKLNNEKTSYWLGMLVADGHLASRKRKDNIITYQLVLNLSKIDISHIRKFHTFIGGHLGIRKNCVCVQSQSSPDWNWLKQYGFTKGKTSRLKWPKIKNIRHFVRGFFDGDGWVTYQKCKRGNQWEGTAGFISISKSFLSRLQKWLYSHDVQASLSIYQRAGSIGRIKNKIFIRKKNVYILAIRQVDSFEKFYNLIYTDASIYLNRKYNKFKQILQHRVNVQTITGRNVTHRD